VSIPVNGRLVEVPGVVTVPPAAFGGPRWAKLSDADHRVRPKLWIRQIIIHSTRGQWPQPIVEAGGGKGSGGQAQHVADVWATDPAHSAAQILVDAAGVVTSFCDVGLFMAYHAEGSNPWSVGIEMHQREDGCVFRSTIDATVKTCIALCAALDIPFQYNAAPYHNAPLHRMEQGERAMRHNIGGPDCVGIFGHRDNTSERGRGDPGDAIYSALEAAGADGFDFEHSDDLRAGIQRQAALNARGESLKLDGICGPASMAAMRRQGFASWRDIR